MYGEPRAFNNTTAGTCFAALKNHDSMKQRPRRRRLQGNGKHLPDAGDRVTHEY
ncbi:hypothetical protein F442_22911 [Phytophthora nicotianae P10297]|uniref:Uncharacterized protein n=2 Tax=Phytophthora nicotianae TaxID=4792 RepID=W2PS98_PHYN3|nr:hypothetical protein PPTG_23857 [Phytophthora nicotianae INRA-310]ETN02895.1 hypothetical protein PPTG_23857 [Phytophthora nicotianae INRA-310]ETP27806.1 hypothetical protein F442_22911 [Phytophthora nicotianae P10297]